MDNLRRKRQLKRAARLVDRLNAGGGGKQLRAARALAFARPRVTAHDAAGRPLGYDRHVITALRPYGQATLWWHFETQSFRVKLDRTRKGSSDRILLLDKFVRAGDGTVGRCRVCGKFYVRRDRRMLFCSPLHADRARQRRHRRPRVTPEVKAARADARAAGIAAKVVVARYAQEQREAALDRQARQQQAGFRSGRLR